MYQVATHSQRQRVHAALASAFTGEDNVDRRVWHQAMATLTGDEEVTAALEASAHRAELRAGHSLAATAFLRAAELSTEEPRRMRRIAAAAGAARHAGQPDRARAARRCGTAPAGLSGGRGHYLGNALAAGSGGPVSTIGSGTPVSLRVRGCLDPRAGLRCAGGADHGFGRAR